LEDPHDFGRVLRCVLLTIRVVVHHLPDDEQQRDTYWIS
jgi:hypothetical protein